MRFYGKLERIDVEERPIIRDILHYGYIVLDEVHISPNKVIKQIEYRNVVYVVKEWRNQSTVENRETVLNSEIS